MDRRRFLIASVATSIVLAGCSEEGPADEEPEDGESDQEDGNESGDDGAIDESEGNETDSNETAEEDEGSETENESDGDGTENETENDTVEDNETDEAENETGEDGTEDDTGEDGTENETAEGDESNEAENETDGDGEGDRPETSVLTVEVTTQWREPIADATVTVGEETARTDGDGVATFELEAGTYTVEAAAGPYLPDETDVTLDGDETVAFHLEREYDGIEIVDHDVGITSREESDDTIDATVVVENRTEYDTENVWVEVTVYDDEGDELGHAMSRNFSVSAGGREEVDVLVDRSEYEDYSDEPSIGSYEIVLDSIPSPGTIDEVSGGTESNAFAVRGLLGGLLG